MTIRPVRPIGTDTVPGGGLHLGITGAGMTLGIGTILGITAVTTVGILLGTTAVGTLPGIMAACIPLGTTAIMDGMAVLGTT